MKKIFIISFIFTVWYSLSLYSQVQCGDTIISNNIENLKVRLYYFHVTHRCNTCFAIESNIRKTLTDYFFKELTDGTISLQVLNSELPQNESLVKQYNAYGAAFILTSYEKNKDVKPEDLTAWAFQKSNNTQLFVTELKKMIEQRLK